MCLGAIALLEGLAGGEARVGRLAGGAVVSLAFVRRHVQTTTCSSTSAFRSKCSSPTPQRQALALQEELDDHPCHRYRTRLRDRRRRRRRRLRELSRRHAFRRRDRLYDGEERTRRGAPARAGAAAAAQVRAPPGAAPRGRRRGASGSGSRPSRASAAAIPFVLFFEGLARADATQATFIHKTLVVWVALLAVPLLRERLGPAHVAAIGLVLAGQAGSRAEPGRLPSAGETMILAATLLWAVEVVLVKRLLDVLAPRPLAAADGARDGVLVSWLAFTGRVGDLLALGAEQWGWAALTELLAGYVASWYAALARAQAVDVTAVLVFGAVVTALIANAADGQRSIRSA